MTERQKVSPEEAATVHNMVSDDERMPNGELRFRRKKLTDGTAYIRTEADTKGGWQQSHYHKHVRETYIVQKGWIGYAQLVDGEMSVEIYRAGQLFTTRPGFLHSVYMPGGTVIHTVKHGDAPPDDLDDRKIDHLEQDRFTKMTAALSEDDIQRWAIAHPQSGGSSEKQEIYTAEYRHFDNLIWQLPTWSTAIFALTAVGANSILNAGNLLSGTQLTPGALASGLFGLMFLVILVLSHATYRFRKHQARLKLYPRAPIWSSASTYFQLIVTVEAFVLLFLVLLLDGMQLKQALWICLIPVAGLTIYREYKLRHKPSDSHVTI